MGEQLLPYQALASGSRAAQDGDSGGNHSRKKERKREVFEQQRDHGSNHGYSAHYRVTPQRATSREAALCGLPCARIELVRCFTESHLHFAASEPHAIGGASA